MNRTEWIEYLCKEAEQPFEGWDFSYLTGTGRMQDSPLSWNYASVVQQRMKGKASMLDMGTGGGELLSMLRLLPAHTVATEGYPPNVQIARNRLEPLGAAVAEADGEESLPFPDQSFELVVNRHEAYIPAEVYRVLTDGGVFVTQQVGGQDNLELNRLLDIPSSGEYSHWNLAYAVEELREAGFAILQQKEEMGFTRYYDIGAIVYYVNAIIWQFPGFSVESHADRLLSLHKRIEAEGYIDIPTHRFFLTAQRPE